jgi:hypothetical protein
MRESRAGAFAGSLSLLVLSRALHRAILNILLVLPGADMAFWSPCEMALEAIRHRPDI